MGSVSKSPHRTSVFERDYTNNKHEIRKRLPKTKELQSVSELFGKSEQKSRLVRRQKSNGK